MLISEILNKKIEYEITQASRKVFIAEAIIGDRKIVFEADSDNGLSWDVSFYERTLSKNHRDYAATGSGHELKVFSMIKECLTELVKRYEPDEVTFSADKNDNATRADLYDRLLKRFRIPGYSYTREQSSRNDYFRIRKDGVEFDY